MHLRVTPEPINPYASPSSLQDPAIETRIQSLKWLRGAALGIIIVACFELVGSVSFVFDYVAQAMIVVFWYRQPLAPPSLWRVAQFILAVLIFFRGLFMIVGSLRLRSGRNYRKANLAAILSMLGIFHPMTWFSVPFGIWAYILLRREKYKQLLTN